MDRTVAITVGALLLVGSLAAALPPDMLEAPRGETPATASVTQTAASASDGTTMAWELIDCEFVVAFGLAATDRVQEHLPDGFRARSIPTRYVGQAPGAGTLVGIESETCQSGTGLEGQTIEDAAYASVWVAVDPPDQREVEGFQGGYYVNWDPLIPDADRRAAFHDAGVPAHDGAIRIEPLADPLAGASVASSYELERLGAFEVQATVPEDPTGVLSGSFYQWTEADDGDLARWRVDWAMESFHQGPGTVHLPPGSWLANLFGTDTVPAPLVYHGTWDYTDGRIWLPS